MEFSVSLLLSFSASFIVFLILEHAYFIARLNNFEMSHFWKVYGFITLLCSARGLKTFSPFIHTL